MAGILSEQKDTSVRPSVLVAAGGIGNVLEWFDFGVFAYFAAEIGSQFFPKASTFAQLLMGFSVFAVAYIMRPVGGVLLGWAGDKFGRKAMLRYSIVLMGVASFAIGLLPTYEMIGIAAPILLVLLRMIQGISVGGEYTGSMTLTTELADKSRRGFVSASATAGVGAGLLLASATAWGTREVLGADAMASWGWRIPFLLGIFIMAAGSWVRRHIPDYEAAHEDAGPPPEEHVLIHSFKEHWRVMIMIILIVAAPNATFYLTNIWLVDVLRVHSANGGWIQGSESAAMAFAMLSPLLGGWLSDIFGRKRTLIVFTILLAVCSWPLLALAYQGGPLTVLFALCMFTFLETVALGVHGALLVELTPVHARTCVFGISYNASMAIFGGLIPVFAMILARHSIPIFATPTEGAEPTWMGPMSIIWSQGYEPMSVVWIPIVLSVAALIVLVRIPETKDRRIDA